MCCCVKKSFLNFKSENAARFIFLKKWADPGLFLFIIVLSNTNFTEKTLGFSVIQTWIVGVEGKLTDH